MGHHEAEVAKYGMSGWTKEETRQLGSVNPHTMTVFSNPKYPGKVEITTHPDLPTNWAYRSARSGAGTGARPQGGRSPSSLSNFLKSLNV